MDKILKVFGKKASSPDAIIKKFKSLSRQKADLEAEAEQLKGQALDGPVEDAGDISLQLADIRSQLEVCAVAMDRTRQELITLLTKQVENDFAALPAKQAKFDSDKSEAAFKTGQKLGEALVYLTAFNQSQTSQLLNALKTQYEKSLKSLGPKLADFARGVDSATIEGIDFPNFRAERQKLLTAKDPALEATKRSIEKKADLSLGVTKIQREAYLYGGPITA